MKRCLLLLVFALSACAQHQPFESADISEIPDGPGLFSGEDGEWTIYKKQ